MRTIEINIGLNNNSFGFFDVTEALKYVFNNVETRFEDGQYNGDLEPTVVCRV